jgi:hypothetical protein
MKHSVGFPLDKPEAKAITEALDIAQHDVDAQAGGRSSRGLVATVVRDAEHDEAGEYLVVVRDA